MSKIKGTRVGSGKERMPPKPKRGAQLTKGKKTRKQKTESHGKATPNTTKDIGRMSNMMGRSYR